MGISISWLEISRWDLSAIDKEGFLTNYEGPLLLNKIDFYSHQVMLHYY
jgi:hypothetical protein